MSTHSNILHQAIFPPFRPFPSHQIQRKKTSFIAHTYTHTQQTSPHFSAYEKDYPFRPRPYNMFKAILAGIGLGLFNLAFVVGLYSGIIGIVIGLGGMSLGISFAGIALIIATFFVAPYLSTPFNLSIGLGKLACFISGIGLLSLGLLLLILTVFISKLILQVTISYIKANVELVKKAGN